jgi:hypothetical protein
MSGMPIPAQRFQPAGYREPSNLADVLERVLDKGIVIAGDVTIDLLKIELLTIKLRLLIASADKAREMGIDWWASDPYLSGGAHELVEENDAMKSRIDRLERIIESLDAGGEDPHRLEAGERDDRRDER